MTVQRFRDVADMPPPERADPKDPSTWRTIRELWAFAERGLPPLYPPGVARFRTIEDANDARDAAVLERMRATRAARGT